VPHMPDGLQGERCVAEFHASCICTYTHDSVFMPPPPPCNLLAVVAPIALAYMIVFTPLTCYVLSSLISVSTQAAEKVCILPCMHQFHCRCIDGWFGAPIICMFGNTTKENNNTCPACKKKAFRRSASFPHPVHPHTHSHTTPLRYAAAFHVKGTTSSTNLQVVCLAGEGALGMEGGQCRRLVPCRC
jgi:hypothetical protein